MVLPVSLSWAWQEATCKLMHPEPQRNLINNQNKPKMPLSAQAASSCRKQLMSGDISPRRVFAAAPLVTTRHTSWDRYRAHSLFSCPGDACGQKRILSIFEFDCSFAALGI